MEGVLIGSALGEVLFNIPLNSIEAMPGGGTLTFKTGTDDGYVGVQRSGLGLSISYGTIHRHHGEIRAESREGVGATLRIALPAAKGEKERREADGERS
jgi:signal transduction histidine kinase